MQGSKVVKDLLYFASREEIGFNAKSAKVSQGAPRKMDLVNHGKLFLWILLFAISKFNLGYHAFFNGRSTTPPKPGSIVSLRGVVSARSKPRPSPDNLCSKIKVGQSLEQHRLCVLRERNPRVLKNPNLEEMNAPKAILMNAWPYLEDKMNLPVPELESAIPFYISILGFELAGKSTDPHPRAELIRDHIRIGLAENGGDPSQEGCFIEVDNAGEAFEEFKFNGLQKEISGMDIEKHGDRSWKTFYVVAPDGLCFCFGEKV